MLTLERLRLCAYGIRRQITDRGLLPEIGRRFSRIGCTRGGNRAARLQSAAGMIHPLVQVVPSNQREAIRTLQEMAAGWLPPDDSGDAMALHEWTFAPAAEVRTNAEFIARIRHHASACRLHGTIVGDFLARHLEELASLVRWTGAKTPAEYEDRLSSWETSAHNVTRQETDRCDEPYLD